MLLLRSVLAVDSVCAIAENLSKLQQQRLAKELLTDYSQEVHWQVVA
jgi:hypothetical protein